MPRVISNDLQTHIESEATTLATCWKITRTDTTVMGFTDHVSDITFGGQDYVAATGFQPTDVLQRDDMSVDNMDVAGILNASFITEEDIQAGLYDFAEVEIFMVNYDDISEGRMWLKRGWIGEVKLSRGQFQAEIRGLAQKINQNIGRLFSPSCDAILGDARCGVNTASFTGGPVSVTAVTNNQTFDTDGVITSATHFKGGELTWLTGNNAGRQMEVKEYPLDAIMTLVLPMSKSVQVGDTFVVVAGCNKSPAACKDKFNNFLNFRGFPDVPGQDKSLETAGTFTADES